jgi:hypothetical protein
MLKYVKVDIDRVSIKLLRGVIDKTEWNEPDFF